MILKSFSRILSLIIFAFFFNSLSAEDNIDIWKKNNNKTNQSSEKIKPKQNSFSINKKKEEINSDGSQKIQIENTILDNSEKNKIFGVYDPEEFNFSLNMWSTTKADDVRSSLNRIKKIKLSKTSGEILENILLSFSYPPEGMNDKEFVKLKIDWMINNNKPRLIENFLKQNKEFDGKSRAVQYLVDQSISDANIKQGCEKIEFIDTSIKDQYLEKFKIYCLVFNNKKSQAQLLLDLLREQKLSDKFFDDKINYLLGISEKTSNKVNEKNLLNFYLSSITIKDFNYTPSKKTKKEIWKYLNAANLIKVDDISDMEKIKELEVAANNGQVNAETIFNIYKQIPFNLNTLINAQNLYQTLESIESRSLIYQKYLLSEDIESKLDYLFLLESLFKKENLQNIYSKKLSDSLRELDKNKIPEKYTEIVEKKLIFEKENTLGKVRYNDKIIHQSKILKFYLENEGEKKIQKDIDKIFKKISKNKKYFYSAKDLALAESLIKDGFQIPSTFDKDELAKKYDIPKNLLQLINNKQNAFLALKIVEIIGEDEPYQLDPETVYFITNLLNETDLIKIRNKVLMSALPERV